MGIRFNRFKVRYQSLAVIERSAAAIQKWEQDVARQKDSLVEMRKSPIAESWALQIMESAISGMEENLAALKQNHAQFVSQCRRPSVLFPRGISSQSEQ